MTRRERRVRHNTAASYRGHIRNHLIPHLGHLRLDELGRQHIMDMFEAIEEGNDLIHQLAGSSDPLDRAQARGRRATNAATMHRIRATLRAALNAAIVEGWLSSNPATHLDMPDARRPTPLLWTEPRVREWQATARVPSRVMVWTAAQLGAFLDSIAEERLYALFHLMAYHGLRRGEACGLLDADIDLDENYIHVRSQLVEYGGVPTLTEPISRASEAQVPIVAQTAAAVDRHRATRAAERAAAGNAWTETGLLFVNPDGTALQPSRITDAFATYRRRAGLPPTRLCDLRYGTATLALAAGIDLRTVAAMMRHSSIVVAGLYSTVTAELAHEVAQSIRDAVPRRAATSPAHRAERL
jgi:integrase